MAVTTYASLVTLHRRTGRAWATVDVVLRQRHKELRNLVAADRDPPEVRLLGV